MAAVFLLARQNDNSAPQIIAPSLTQSAHALVRVFVNGAVVKPRVYTLDSKAGLPTPCPLAEAPPVRRRLTV